MKILIPNAKELHTNQDAFPSQLLSAKSQAVLKALQKYFIESLANFYKINSSKADREWTRWQRLTDKQAKTYPTWLLYDSLMYRYMKRTQVTEAERHYFDNYLRVTTALYGLISPITLTTPHHSDFRGNLKINNTSLKQFWRRQYDGEVQGDELIISLLSSEFEQVFSPNIRKRMVKIVFTENRNGKPKVRSTISKKGCGRLVSPMTEKRIETIEQIKRLTFDGFRFSPESSQDQTLTSIREQE